MQIKTAFESSYVLHVFFFLGGKRLALGPVQENAVTHSKHCSHFKASHMEALNTGHQINWMTLQS